MKTLLRQRLSTPTAVDVIDPSEARLRMLLTGLMLFVGPLLLLVFYDRLMFPGLTNADALDFAQLGRNLSAGRGFVTFVLRPLALIHGNEGLRQPELTHGFLYPFLLALGFGAFGVRDAVVAGMSGLFYLLTIPVVYFLGRRLMDPAVGKIAAFLFTVNTLNLQYAASGLHITLLTFLTSSLFLALCSAVPDDKLNQNFNRKLNNPPDLKLTVGRSTRPALILCGLLAGAMYLTEPLFFWALPVCLGAVLVMYRKQRTAVVWCLVPMALLCAPWILRNILVNSDPLFGLRSAEIWMNTNLYPGYNAYRMPPAGFVPGTGLFLAVVHKIQVSANQIAVTFPQIAAIWILAFFLPSLLFQLQDTAARLVRQVVLAGLLGLFLTMLVFSIQMPLFTCLTPTLMIFAISFLNGLLKQAQIPPSGRLVTALLVGITILYPLYTELIVSDRPLPNRSALTAKWLSHTMERDAVCLSDAPWNVAWYADRPAIWLPIEDTDVATMQKQIKNVRWLFLTEQTHRFSPSWQYIYDVFVRWNISSLQAQAAHSVLPKRITIVDRTHALMKALLGYSSIAPAIDSAPDIVVASTSKSAEQ